MKRKQFTFYESFYRAMRRIESKEARADIFDAICGYALYERKPRVNKIRPEALMMFEMVRPVLDSAHKKAEAAIVKNEKHACTTSANRMHNACTTSAQQVQTGCEGEKEIEKELEVEIERESERAGALAGARADFDIFWKEFPKKVDKQRAWVVFQGVEEPVEVLLEALRKQKKSEQWLEAGGRFVPRAAAWLRERRWEDEVAAPARVPMGASGQLGEAELAAIRKMMAEG